MSSPELSRRIAALHAEASALGVLLATAAPSMEADELFEAAAALQRACNAAEGAQLVAIAHAAAHETRLTDRGPVEMHHGLGFVDQMTSSEVSLATGLGQWAAGRKVSLAANLAERFPRLLEKVVEGDVPCSTVHKVVSVCDGLDLDACAAVQAVLVDRLAGMDPARVTTVARRVATRVAADQVVAASARNKRDRCVEVAAGPDGTTRWWAQLPAGRSAAAWAAITALGDTYADQDPSLTVDQARADALLDLVLTDVEVSASVTLGIPVITGPEGDAARESAVADRARDDSPIQGTPGRTRAGSTSHGQPFGDPPLVATGGLGVGDRFSVSAALTGCQIPRIGWIDADTVEALLSTVPLEVGRALLDARTGTLVETPAAPTAHLGPSPTSSRSATACAACGAAIDRPGAATSTMSVPGRAGPPAPATSVSSAVGTTASSNADGGATPSTPTAPSPGPHHPARSASLTPISPPSHHPCCRLQQSCPGRAHEKPVSRRRRRQPTPHHRSSGSRAREAPALSGHPKDRSHQEGSPTTRSKPFSRVGQDEDMSEQTRHDNGTDEDEAGGRVVPATVTSDGERVVVVTPEGMGVAAQEPGASEPEREPVTNPADLVEHPAKVMRIGSMVKQLLEEVRSAPLDEKGRARMADIHERSIGELKDGLAPELVDELERIALPFKDDAPSDAELRIAQAQLVGWLEGLFHGIQTALVAQQMAAQAQLQQMRALPPGTAHQGMPQAGGPGMPHPGRPKGEQGHAEGTGQYL